MPIDLVKFCTYFSDPFNFYEYLLQKNIGKGIKVRENPVYFKYMTLSALNEANMHYSKHWLKKMFGANEKKMEMINNQLTDEFENLKEIYGEDSLDLI